MKLLDKKILEEKLQSRIGEDVESGRVGGAAVCVMQNGEVVYKNCFGYKDAETKEQLTDGVLYRMASMTKPITAVCIMILAEKGKLSITDPVSKYFPDFAHMNIGELSENGELRIKCEATRQITIENLLSHTSGLMCREIGDAQAAQMTAADKKNLETAVKFYENVMLDFEPGEKDWYSPVAAFDVLARIIEIVSGMKFADFARENIFAPLGMDNTTFTPSEEAWGKMIKMSDFKDGKAVNADVPKCVFADFPASYTCGGAGVVSCLKDYSKFAQMLLNEGEYGDVRILSGESVKEMQIPRPIFGDFPRCEIWGLGVRVNKNGFYKSLPEGAYGWSGAYGTHFWVDIENKITAVYMKNSRYDGGSGAKTAANFEKDVYAALK